MPSFKGSTSTALKPKNRTCCMHEITELATKVGGLVSEPQLTEAEFA